MASPPRTGGAGQPPPSPSHCLQSAGGDGPATFYRRALPCPPAVPFSEAEGRAIFREALAEGGMEGYFKLSEQFQTQQEPAFCGLASLAVVLNALSIDPGRAWKGPWRWFAEHMLDCCEPLDKIARDGISLDQVACLGRCNGCSVACRRPPPADCPPPTKKRKAEGSGDGCCAVNCTGASGRGALNKPDAPASFEDFERDVAAACTQQGQGGGAGASHIVVGYTRKAFRQTGDGHFSPVGGYNKGRGLVLILDVARFKYPPHWVPIRSLWEAMRKPDPATGLPRGYLVLRAGPPAPAALVATRRRGPRWRALAAYLAESAERMRVQHQAQGAGPLVLQQLLGKVVGGLPAPPCELLSARGGGAPPAVEAGACCATPAAAGEGGADVVATIVQQLEASPLCRLLRAVWKPPAAARPGAGGHACEDCTGQSEGRAMDGGAAASGGPPPAASGPPASANQPPAAGGRQAPPGNVQSRLQPAAAPVPSPAKVGARGCAASAKLSQPALLAALLLAQGPAAAAGVGGGEGGAGGAGECGRWLWTASGGGCPSPQELAGEVAHLRVQLSELSAAPESPRGGA